MSDTDLLNQAKTLKLYGLIEHWEEVHHTEWLPKLLVWEKTTRAQRSLENRLRSARLGQFKLLVDFDWSWPKKCDREAIEACMQLHFLLDASNIILCGPNGVGKSTLACNIAHTAVMVGHTVLVTTAGQMLNELASQEGDNALRRRMKYYTQVTIHHKNC